jgi:hypothetical protein
MTRGEPVNERLLSDLERFKEAPDFLEEIADALGAEYYEDLTRTEDYPVQGYFLRVGEVFGLYVVTPGRFCIYERNKAHETLSIAVPIERVRRVVSARANDVLRVSLEIEADSAPVRLEGRVLSEPRLVNGVEIPGSRYAESSFVGSIGAVTYDWSGVDEAGSDREDDLKDFARALRNTIGF